MPEPVAYSVLVLSVTEGARRDSIPAGNEALQAIGEEIAGNADIESFSVDIVDSADPEDAQSEIPSTVEAFEAYDAVVFQNTTGAVLVGDRRSAFKQYVEGGGGFVGIHAAADTHTDWEWYATELLGATATGSPAVQEAELHVTDRTHPSTEHLPARWVREEQWYDFDRNPRGDVHVLASLDEQTYDGAAMDGGFGRDHPIAWCRRIGQGRAFYTGGGHTSATFGTDAFRTHLEGALLWAVGHAGGDAYGTVWDAYEKDTVVGSDELGLEPGGRNGPMAIDVADDGRIFFIGRRGTVRMVTETGNVRTVAELDIYTGDDDGLLAITLDPDFEENNWLYLYYSPLESELPDDLQSRLGTNHVDGGNGVIRLSRFTLQNGSLGEETQILDVINQRVTRRHSGAALDFDSQGNLFLSTGDDTNTFESDGYTPIDERSGRKPFDAQRSSGNTDDLRGSLIRISPIEDGSYEVPDGNLIDTIDGASEDSVRPELYAIGLRNPFTMQVDVETDTPYVADYGPDSGSWNASRGPPGQTEFARIDDPGFYGWPYVTGENVPYREYDFDTGESGRIFDPDAPTNDSVNNSGLEDLPPAKGAFVSNPYSWSVLLDNPPEWDAYMPYDGVEEVPFPQVTGGAPTQGPVYRYRDTFNPASALPESYEGKIFFLEWGGGWIKYATLDDDGEIMEVDPFLPDTEFRSPHDTAVGPDGSLYVIEWGDGFGGDNPEISRIGPSDAILPTTLSVSGLGGEVTLSTTQTLPVEATLTNQGSTPITDGTLTLEASSEEITVSADSGTSFDSLAGGASQTATWNVTLPGDLASGDYTLEATGTYTTDGTEIETSSSLSFTVR
jgi:glucose/arabinose dehydrogenase/type 1 glutamine amidotransferase